MKLARQFFLEKQHPEPRRIRFISRKQSYHGTTLGALAMGGHVTRRAKFEPMLVDTISKVSPCFSYRGKNKDETDEAYVKRLADELDDEFQRVGPDTVCAFVAEPVVGAALGCVPAVSGYLKAMQTVCRKYGSLLIVDEVMCGMGRTGSYHAWQEEGIVPDIQTVGKGLAGGYQPVAGVLIHKDIVDTLEKGTASVTTRCKPGVPMLTSFAGPLCTGTHTKHMLWAVPQWLPFSRLFKKIISSSMSATWANSSRTSFGTPLESIQMLATSGAAACSGESSSSRTSRPKSPSLRLPTWQTDSTTSV